MNEELKKLGVWLSSHLKAEAKMLETAGTQKAKMCVNHRMIAYRGALKELNRLERERIANIKNRFKVEPEIKHTSEDNE